MKKSFGIVALSIVSLLSIPNNSILAASAELPENFEEIQKLQEIESRMSIYNIVISYNSYQGSSVSYNYTERQSNGDTYYYRGTLNYVGKNGIFGPYQYLGDKREFELYKIVTSSGTTITPRLYSNN